MFHLQIIINASCINIPKWNYFKIKHYRATWHIYMLLLVIMKCNIQQLTVKGLADLLVEKENLTLSHNPVI